MDRMEPAYNRASVCDTCMYSIFIGMKLMNLSQTPVLSRHCNNSCDSSLYKCTYMCIWTVCRIYVVYSVFRLNSYLRCTYTSQESLFLIIWSNFSYLSYYFETFCDQTGFENVCIKADAQYRLHIFLLCQDIVHIFNDRHWRNLACTLSILQLWWQLINKTKKHCQHNWHCLHCHQHRHYTVNFTVATTKVTYSGAYDVRYTGVETILPATATNFINTHASRRPTLAVQCSIQYMKNSHRHHVHVHTVEWISTLILQANPRLYTYLAEPRGRQS